MQKKWHVTAVVVLSSGSQLRGRASLTGHLINLRGRTVIFVEGKKRKQSSATQMYTHFLDFSQIVAFW